MLKGNYCIESKSQITIYIDQPVATEAFGAITYKSFLGWANEKDLWRDRNVMI